MSLLMKFSRQPLILVSVFQFICTFFCVAHFTNSHVEALYLWKNLYSRKNQKRKKVNLKVNKKKKQEKKTDPKKSTILSRKEKNSFMKPLVLAELYAGVQISNKEVAVKSKLSNIMLKTRFPFIYASISRDTKTLTIASILCLASQQIFRLSIFAAGLFFACGNFARCVVLLNAPLSNRDEKKASVTVYSSREILI